jgi:hypothetical protein
MPAKTFAAQQRSAAVQERKAQARLLERPLEPQPVELQPVDLLVMEPQPVAWPRFAPLPTRRQPAMPVALRRTSRKSGSHPNSHCRSERSARVLHFHIAYDISQ